MWIDSHAHLDRIPENELLALLDEAERSGVSTVLSVATDLASAEKVVRQCAAYSSIYGAAGISPFDACSLPGGWESRLRSFLANERIVAVGEIGIDDSNPKYPAVYLQLPVFEAQLHVANENNLPVIVHSRGAEKKVADICRANGITGALFHCFTGDRAALSFILDCGYSVSFSGIITFAEEVRALVPCVPLDRLFIETDTPYLAPLPHRGKANRPAWVALVGETAARCLGVTPEELQAALRRNFEKLFAL